MFIYKGKNTDCGFLRKDTEENILKKEGGVNINVEK
jgi:hypothetical protein